MTYVSLYRKWRPQTFEEVVGQEYVTRTLANSLRNGNFAHAYLFAGPRGTGKTSTARILAKALNCIEGPTPSPCNRCDSCRAITEGSSVDVVEIDAASNRGIDDIRDLREKVIFTPASSRVKVYILDEAHMITRDAFNAFLKTLEEPPAHVVFVLATTEPYKVPQTILSRCQRYDFRSVPVSLMCEFLEKVAEEEGFKVSGDALRLVARRARGSVRDALVFLEQLASYGDGVLDETAAAGFLGLVEEEMLVRMGESLASGRIGEIIALVEQAYEEGKDLAHFAGQVQEHFRRVFLLQHAELNAADLEVDEVTLQEIKKQAAAVSPERAGFIISSLQQVQEEMKRSSAPRLVLESALVAMAREELATTPEALAARLEGLERKLEKALRRGAEAAAAVEAGPREIRGAQGTREVRERREKEVHGPAAREGSAAEEAREGKSRPQVPPASAAGIDIAAVRRAWPHIKERVKERKVITHALLLEGKPVEVREGGLVISLPPDRAFHRDELEKESNKKVVEAALEEVLGVRLGVSVQLEEGGDKGGGGERREDVPAREKAEKAFGKAAETAVGGADDKVSLKGPRDAHEREGASDEGGVERREGTLEKRAAEGTVAYGTAGKAAAAEDEEAEGGPEQGSGEAAAGNAVGKNAVGKTGAAAGERESAARAKEGAAVKEKKVTESHEAGKVKLVKDVFGAEMVEEIRLSE